MARSSNPPPPPLHTPKAAIGAPAQHNQKTRKGKKAWRKNVNIDDVEQGLEEMRQEERVVGKPLQKQKDEDLFVVDTKGDDEIRKTIPKFSSLNLTSTKIISQRSAVPALISRVTSSAASSHSYANATTNNKKRKLPPAGPSTSSTSTSTSTSTPTTTSTSTLTRSDKERLLSTAKKARKGPFNAIMDPSEYQPGENAMRLGLSEAVKQSGGYDPWGGISPSTKASIVAPSGGAIKASGGVVKTSGGAVKTSGGAKKASVEDEAEVDENNDMEDIDEDVADEDDGFQPPKPVVPRAPQHKRGSAHEARAQIAMPAVRAPHAGASYNPPEDAHRALVMEAAEAEARKVRELERMGEVKRRIEKLKETGAFGDEEEEEGGSGRAGMRVQSVSEEEEEEAEEGGEGEKKVKLASRKTTAQKNRAAKVLEQKRTLAKKALSKALLSSIDQAKALRKALAAGERRRVEAQEARRVGKAAERRERGMAGVKLGKHRVPKSEMEVQVGEDLSESLRGLKPEGNLFRDRFESLQQRALIEPRALVLPKKRRRRVVEYEKHAWKNFE